MQTPNKQGDDGWKSVLYEGQPLEMYRRRYSGKPRTPQPRRGSASAQDGDEVSNTFQPSFPILCPVHCPGCPEIVAAMQLPSTILCQTLMMHFLLGPASYRRPLTALVPAPQEMVSVEHGGRSETGTPTPNSKASGAEAAAADPETEQWVQCDRCRTWRVVPGQHWPALEADSREVSLSMLCRPNKPSHSDYKSCWQSGRDAATGCGGKVLCLLMRIIFLRCNVSLAKLAWVL